MARISKWCPVCAKPQRMRFELQPLSAGQIQWLAWCWVCNTPAPADGPVLQPAEVAVWLAHQRTLEPKPGAVDPT